MFDDTVNRGALIHRFKPTFR